MTTDEMLIEVNKAIYSVLAGGQSYKIGSRSLTRADLSMLKQMRDDLTAQSEAKNATNLLSDTYVTFFEGR